MSITLIAWDMGATKCAAGIITYDTRNHEFHCEKETNVKLAQTRSLDDLIAQLEDGLGMRMAEADAICIGAAGQYDGEVLNHLKGVYPYEMTFAAAAKAQGWPAFDVIHDYSPIVCATFTSYLHTPSNIKRLNTAAMNPHGRRIAVGIGTGLGMKDGVMLASGDFWLGKNEVGHVGVPHPPLADQVTETRHRELIRFLATENPSNPTITFEKILSGTGLSRLHAFLYPSEGRLSPEQVGERLHANQAPELLKVFAYYLGLLVGTLELTFMPEGGIWVAGGVALRHINAFDQPDFKAGIDASPAYAEERSHYPQGVLVNPQHALIGGGYYAVKRLVSV